MDQPTRWPIAAVLVIVAVVLAGLFPVFADEGEPSFDPKGEIYETQSRVDDTSRRPRRFAASPSSSRTRTGGDVLTRDALLELKQNQDKVLADADAPGRTWRPPSIVNSGSPSMASSRSPTPSTQRSPAASRRRLTET